VQGADEGISSAAGVIVAVVTSALCNINLSGAGPFAVSISFGLSSLG